MPSGRQALGNHGESLVARWYEERGYEVVARNWRTRSAELDLVLSRDGELVFCEVKTRAGSRYGTPAEAVTVAKQHKVRQAAIAYLGQRAPDERARRLRFDVACVIGREIEVIEAAF